jgi:hypothetical protein
MHQIENAFNLFYANNGNYYNSGSGANGSFNIHNNNWGDSQACVSATHTVNPGHETSGLAPYISNPCGIFGPNGLNNSDFYRVTFTSSGQAIKLGAAFETSAYQGAQFTDELGNPYSGFYEIKH